MEINARIPGPARHLLQQLCSVACCIFLSLALHAQPAQRYTVKEGRMVITLERTIPDTELKKFIGQFDLEHLAIDRFLRDGFGDSLRIAGWRIDNATQKQVVFSKPLEAYESINDPAERILFTGKQLFLDARFPVVSNLVKYGCNQFRHPPAFAVRDSSVQFFLRGNTNASRVMLAGSFNHWDPRALSMQRTDSGWIAAVHLRPGKFWYKFIIDGKWVTDPDNRQQENDGLGNTNSVYFFTNHVFRLSGFQQAKQVTLSGSFNGWNETELKMERTAYGWSLPLYLSEGTHTYRFIADGQWLIDPGNPDKLPNEFGEYNSVLGIGSPYRFRLDGYTGAKQVVLSGSFNQWRTDELFLHRSATGWELSYITGPGNFQYRFLADGMQLADPSNPPVSGNNSRPSALVIAPNYTFRLKGFENAKRVCLAGTFNEWSPDGFEMQKINDEWVIRQHLEPGKHLYKFVVDGKWILDPANEFWEENEHQTGNSVLWLEKKDLQKP